MLVLTRKSREQIYIGQHIVVSIVEIQRNKVRVSIDAPHHVKILRGELAQEKNGHVPPRQRRLLLVDGNPLDRATYRQYIAGSGGDRYAIQEAEHGEQALALCKQQPPDCVFLNYRLPDVDGLQFLDRLHSDGQGHRVPVVVIATDGNESLAVQAMKFGAVDYLPKRDLSAERLQRCLQEVLG
jgi:carbon storage regulator CsrA